MLPLFRYLQLQTDNLFARMGLLGSQALVMLREDRSLCSWAIPPEDRVEPFNPWTSARVIRAWHSSSVRKFSIENTRGVTDSTFRVIDFWNANHVGRQNRIGIPPGGPG